MDDRKLEIIKQLMEELESEMDMSHDDLGERLGRPKVEIDMKSDKSPDMPMDGDMPMGMGDSSDMDGSDDMSDMDEMDPDEKLKQRIMKMRG